MSEAVGRDFKEGEIIKTLSGPIDLNLLSVELLHIHIYSLALPMHLVIVSQ